MLSTFFPPQKVAKSASALTLYFGICKSKIMFIFLFIYRNLYFIKCSLFASLWHAAGTPYGRKRSGGAGASPRR